MWNCFLVSNLTDQTSTTITTTDYYYCAKENEKYIFKKYLSMSNVPRKKKLNKNETKNWCDRCCINVIFETECCNTTKENKCFKISIDKSWSIISIYKLKQKQQ